jgi:predicted esterase YcpF (UPF0227 family)
MSVKRPAVLYLHGFNSSPDSLKARQFKEYCRSNSLAEVLAPALSHDPEQAMNQLNVLMQNPQTAPVLVVGSSLGGFYATCLAERHGVKAALINPAVAPGDHLDDRFIGRQKNFHTGEEYEFTREHAEVLRRLTVRSIRKPEQYLLLVQTGDEVLDYRHATAFYAGCRQIVQEGGNHSFENFAAMLPVISSFAGLE